MLVGKDYSLERKFVQVEKDCTGGEPDAFVDALEAELWEHIQLNEPR